jgi:protein tyrosine phosphatase (PTP) superfamily phosphohydrolase (DUF442 family)
MLKPRVFSCCLIIAAIGCGPAAFPPLNEASTGTATKDSVETTPPSMPQQGIHNLLKVSPLVYSGSEPHGEAGMASVARLGVKTIVSVDGAKPDVALAKKHGLRYVHIPIGYDGVPTDAANAFTRLVKEVEGPHYIHCHHGRHRGPAAAAVACIAAGELQNQEALQILVQAGTSKDYAGLWRDVEHFTPPSPETVLPKLHEIAEVDSFTAAMSQIDRSFDNLKLCRDANWSVPPDHPDIAPAQEALLLEEGLHEALRNLDDGYDEQFRAWLREAESIAVALGRDLQNHDPAAASARLKLVENSCKQCHHSYRD